MRQNGVQLEGMCEGQSKIGRPDLGQFKAYVTRRQPKERHIIHANPVLLSSFIVDYNTYKHLRTPIIAIPPFPLCVIQLRREAIYATRRR
jgi:hypothetical protein